jgi:hypothetical protein
LRDPLRSLAENNVGDAPQGLEFSVEGDSADAIDAGYAPAPNDAKDQLRAADKSEGLSDHRMTSVPCGKAHTAYFNEWSSSALGDVA